MSVRGWLWMALVLAAPHWALAQQPASGGKYALLVGVSNYEYEPISDLVGPANDVVLWRQTLVDSYGFRHTDIVTLAEADDAAGKPTRAHIQEEMRKLADKVQPGDQVIISLSGHGSQQPDKDKDDGTDPEPDGLDEIFLPSDAGVGRTGRELPNVIVDDELRAWLGAITAKGAQLWFIADCCHSGTVLRGVADETVRRVDPEDLFGFEAIDEAQRDATTTTRDVDGKTESGAADGQQLLDNVVALYAAQSTEPTIELNMPKGSPDAKSYGLLTYSVCEMLVESAANKSQFTYAEMVQNLYARYQAMGRVSPTPLVEGALSSHFVLGGAAGNRPDIVLTEGDDGWTIKAGSLQGLTQGSKLLVFPPAGSEGSDQPLGHVEITTLRVLDADVAPCSFGDMAAPEKLPANGRCQLAYIEYDVNPLTLAVTGDVAGEWTSKLKQTIAQGEAQGRKSPVAVVDNPAEADWVVWLDPSENGAVPRATLLPATGLSTDSTAARTSADAEALPERIGQLNVALPLDDSLPGVLEGIARRIKRVQGLLELGTQSTFGIDVDVELYRLAGEADLRKFRTGDVEGLEKISWQRDGMTLQVGDIVGVEVTNPNDDAIDVTLLYLDSAYGISSVYPQRNRISDNRLQYNRTYRTALQITKDTVGMERLVAIALRAERDAPPVNFTSLEQESLAAMRQESATRGHRNPLEDLLEDAMYTGTRAGMVLDLADNHKIKSISFRVEPAGEN